MQVLGSSCRWIRKDIPNESNLSPGLLVVDMLARGRLGDSEMDVDCERRSGAVQYVQLPTVKIDALVIA
jgi:hypothetical protein